MSFIAGLTMFLVDCVCCGFVLSRLWGWFVVPQFGVKPLSVLAALGLATTVNFVTVRVGLKEDEKWEAREYWSRKLLICVTRLIILAFGYAMFRLMEVYG